MGTSPWLHNLGNMEDKKQKKIENKARKLDDLWDSITRHMKETITLQSWSQEEFSAESNEWSIL